MSRFLNHVTIAAPRNGTTSHTVSPASGTVVAGALFTPTAGRMLVCVVEAAATSTTPTGWTLGGSALAYTGVYVWYLPSAAGSDTVTTTHGPSNYPAVFDFYEFPPATTWVNAVGATGVAYNGAGPTISSLTGKNQVYGAAGQYTDSTYAGPYSGSWSAGTEIVDTSAAYATTYGYTYGATEFVDYTSATASAAWTSTNSAYTVERLMWAVKITTPALWASGTPATSGTTWANPTYATAANNAAFATYTTSTSGAVGYIGCSGYGAQTAIGAAPASVDSVAVTVYGYVNTVARWTSMTVGLFDGATQVGSSQTMTLTTTTTNSQTFTFTGVSWANLANLTIRVTGTHTGTSSGIMSVDAVKSVVNYTPAFVPSTYAVTSTTVATAAGSSAPILLASVSSTTAATANGSSAPARVGITYAATSTTAATAVGSSAPILRAAASSTSVASANSSTMVTLLAAASSTTAATAGGASGPALLASVASTTVAVADGASAPTSRVGIVSTSAATTATTASVTLLASASSVTAAIAGGSSSPTVVVGSVVYQVTSTTPAAASGSAGVTLIASAASTTTAQSGASATPTLLASIGSTTAAASTFAAIVTALLSVASITTARADGSSAPTIATPYLPVVDAGHARTVPARDSARTVEARDHTRDVPARDHTRTVDARDPIRTVPARPHVRSVP